MINLQTFASENLSFQSDYAILHDGMVIKVHFSIIVLLFKKNELIVKFVTFIQSEKKDTGLPCHIFMIGHSFYFENAEILCQETNWRNRKLLEALYFELPRMHVTSIKDTALTTTTG